MRLFGRRYDNAQPVSVEIAGDKIAQISPYSNARPSDSLPWIAPGLFDVQINGYGGQEFSSPTLTVQRVAQIVRGYEVFGVTRCCPTLFTESFETLAHSLRTIAVACESSSDVSRRVPGIHLEGPYLSDEDGPRGAHLRAQCRPPDWDEFQRLQEAAGGRIRILTMSVEFDRSPQFIRRVARSGVLVAIGHTAADSAHIRAAVDAGARLSTHLGNGCHLALPTHPNYLWDQLAEDRLTASLIVDGRHLPPRLVEIFIRAKTPSRCILVSDISGWAGRPPGRYQAGHGELEILPDGTLVVAGQRQILAGASRPIGAGVANVMHFAGLSLAEAIDMATKRPAQLLGLDPGGLEPGEPADLVLFDLVEPSTQGPGIGQTRCAAPEFRVRCIVVGGQGREGDGTMFSPDDFRDDSG